MEANLNGTGVTTLITGQNLPDGVTLGQTPVLFDAVGVQHPAERFQAFQRVAQVPQLIGVQRRVSG